MAFVFVFLVVVGLTWPVCRHYVALRVSTNMLSTMNRSALPLLALGRGEKPAMAVIHPLLPLALHPMDIEQLVLVGAPALVPLLALLEVQATPSLPMAHAQQCAMLLLPGLEFPLMKVIGRLASPACYALSYVELPLPVATAIANGPVCLLAV